jgi:NADH-quinone oxidoreductase subunit C
VTGPSERKPDGTPGEQSTQRPAGKPTDETVTPEKDTSIDSQAALQTGSPTDAAPVGAPAVVQNAPAATPLVTGVERHGMFGAHGSGDTSGYGLLVRPELGPKPTARPYGGWFDEVADALELALQQRGIPAQAIEQVTVAHGEITFYLVREHLQGILWAVRDEPALRFEMLASLSGADYGTRDGDSVPRQLHVVYEMLSMTYRRRIRLEVAVDIDDPYVPSAVPVYPTADWHEREAYDMFGVIFSGHPALTRILMPDDWDGHPQRKSYALGGIPVEYKGAEIPPPDERRVYS